MTTTQISVRDLAKSLSSLGNYDITEVFDKKRNISKGLFVAPAHAKEVKAFLEKKLEKEKQAKVNNLMQFSGIIKDDSLKNATVQSIKASMKI